MEFERRLGSSRNPDGVGDETTDSNSAKRLNASLLVDWERPVLLDLASRIPSPVTSDHLTLLGVAGAFLAALSYAATNWSPAFLWIASLGLLINWFGDSLDGTVARLRKMERPRMGCFIDHTADLISQVAIGLGFGLSPYLRFDVACLLLISYLVLVAFTFIRATAFGVVKLSYYGVGPTEVRLLLVLSNTFFFFAGNPQLQLFSLPVFGLSDAVAFVIFLMGMGGFLVSVRSDWREFSKIAEGAKSD